ncbi:McrB family protein [Clostridium butyricum]|uniref:McrB family protein n=1 Tax=Clostridium butyricum TaxID=1492 RepID=UPI003F8ED306
MENKTQERKMLLLNENTDMENKTEIIKKLLVNMFNSYKIFWLKGIVEEVLIGNKTILFKNIAMRMICNSWDLLMNNDINLGEKDQLNYVVKKIDEIYSIGNTIDKNEKYEYFKNINDKNFDDLLKKFYEYVPYRLLAPFYDTSLSNKDREKNKMIEKFSQEDENVIYKIFISDNKIIVNDDWYRYIQENNESIDQYIDKVLCEFIEKRNSNIKNANNILESINKGGSSLNSIIDFNISEVVDYIYNYITNKGDSYDKSLIKNLYTSLKTKPFVILSGISGTGKSKIVELFAKALGATTENKRFKLIPVKPDWSDSTDLLGFRNIEGKFTCGEITDIAYRAMMNPEVPYFVCLDEMNLARVEYYFSDILSIMETRRCNEDGEIITNVLLSETQIGRDAASISIYGDVYIPQNLYIIGTVNMDQTTFPFSKKVLDRANTIEFNKVDLSYSFDDEEDTTEYQSDNDKCRVYHNNFLKSEFLKIKDCKENKEIALKTIDRLIGINKILEKYDNHFGYRVRDEIVFYMIYAMKYDLMTFDEAFDLCMVQKILPKIGGSSSDTLEMLASIFEHINDYKIQNKEYMEECELDKMSKDVFLISWENNNDELQIHSNLRKSKYRCTNEKLISMMRRFIRDGFTTFWQ